MGARPRSRPGGLANTSRVRWGRLIHPAPYLAGLRNYRPRHYCLGAPLTSTGPLASNPTTPGPSHGKDQEAKLLFSRLAEILGTSGYTISPSCLDYAWEHIVRTGIDSTDIAGYEREFCVFQRRFAIEAVASMMSKACEETFWWPGDRGVIDTMLTIRRMIDDLGLTAEEIGHTSSSIFKRFAVAGSQSYTRLQADIIPFAETDQVGLSTPQNIEVKPPSLNTAKRWWPYECYWAQHISKPGTRLTVKA